MKKIAIIIPSRLNAERLPDKPLKLIKNKEMVLHVYDVAKAANVGEVIVATPDQKIIDIVENYGGKAILTNIRHQTGTDRVFEVFQKELKNKPEIIVNLQGDMPNLNSDSIKDLTSHMQKKLCDIGTLASDLNINSEEKNPNVVKVLVNKNIKNKEFSNALDFFRISKNSITEFTYHHIGIYAFTSEALIRYVSLERSSLEIKNKLEQLRALENKMKIDVGYVNTCPLSIDTEEDLLKIKETMEN